MSSKRYKDRVNNDDNVGRALNYLVEEKGLPPHIASGIIGNLMQESGQNLNIQALNEDDGGEGVDSYGIAQWQGTRLEDLKRVAGDRINTLEGQLDFMMWEFENTEKHNFKKVMKAEDEREAALFFSKHYERPYEPTAHNDKRMENATKVFGKTPTPPEKVETKPTVEERTTKKDNIPSIDKLNEQLTFQNELLTERLNNYEAEQSLEKKQEVAKNKAAQAQAKLNEKMQQKEMLKQLIMQSGAKYVDSPRRESSSQGAPSYKQGGEHDDPRDPPKDYDFFNDPDGLFDESNKKKADLKIPRDERVEAVQDNTGIAEQRGIEPQISRAANTQMTAEEVAKIADPDLLSDEEFMADIDRRLGMIKDGAGRGIFEPEDERGLTQAKKDGIKATEKITAKEDLGDPIKEMTTQEMEDMLYKYDPSTVKDNKTKLSIDNLTESEYNNLPESDKAKMDKELEKRGLLKSLSVPRGKEETTKVQKMLKEQGYELGNFGVNGDGIDGLVGSKTRGAISKYNKDNAEKTRSEAFENYSRGRGEQESILGEDFQMFQDETDIMGFQTTLQDKGYFKADLNNFDLDFDENNLGKSHKRREIDYSMYEKEVCEYGKECATFVTFETLNTVGAKAFEGSQVRGDAWTMNGNMVKAGGKTLYNVTGGEKPEGTSKQDIKTFLNDKFASAPELDVEGLMEGDAIHLYYGNSGYMEQALEEMEGDMFTTHVGMVKKDAEGNMYVEHNVGQKMYTNTVEELATGTKVGSSDVRISGVTRPKYNVDMAEGTEMVETSSENEYNFENLTNLQSPLLKETIGMYTETLARNKEVLMEDIPVNNQEYRSLEKAAVSIAWKESYGNPEIDEVASQVRNRNPEGVFKKAFAGVAESVFGREASKGLTQMKDEKNLNENLRTSLLEGSDEQLKDPKKAALATMYSLSSRYIYLREISIKEGLKLNEDELAKLSTVAWNEDIEIMGRSLQKYKNFEGIMNAYRTDEDTGEVVGHKYDAALSVYDNMFKLKT